MSNEKVSFKPNSIGDFIQVTDDIKIRASHVRGKDYLTVYKGGNQLKLTMDEAYRLANHIV